MITVDRLSLSGDYKPKAGDLLEITEITGGNGRWVWSMQVAEVGFRQKLPKDVLAWLVKQLSDRDAANFMLWYTVGKPLEAEGGEA